MFPLQSLRSALGVLQSPREGLLRVHEETLEETLSNYLALLLWSGVLAGVVSFVWALLRALYVDIIRGITIDYWHVVNYFSQVLIGTAFLYVFFGTFVMFLLTLALQAFAPRARYVKVVAVTCASAAPLLLFGWIAPRLLLALLVWMLFLLGSGISILKQEAGTKLKRIRRSQRKA